MYDKGENIPFNFNVKSQHPPASRVASVPRRETGEDEKTPY